MSPLLLLAIVLAYAVPLGCFAFIFWCFKTHDPSRRHPNPPPPAWLQDAIGLACWCGGAAVVVAVVLMIL